MIRVLLVDDHKLVRSAWSRCSALPTTWRSSAPRRTARRRSRSPGRPARTWCSWTCRCPAWTAWRPSAGSWPSGPARRWWCSPRSRTATGYSRLSTQVRWATCSRTPSGPSCSAGSGPRCAESHRWTPGPPEPFWAPGLANKQIARRLGITERTVKAHLTSVFQRIGVGDRTSAALWAQRHGLPEG